MSSLNEYTFIQTIMLSILGTFVSQRAKGTSEARPERFGGDCGQGVADFTQPAKVVRSRFDQQGEKISCR